MHMAKQSNRGLAALCLLLVIAPAAMAQTPPPAEAVRAPRVAVTRHEGTFNGQKLRYTATVAESFVNDASGRAAGAATTIAYVRDGVGDAAARPDRR